jgi:hypothetical protein
MIVSGLGAPIGFIHPDGAADKIRDALGWNGPRRGRKKGARHDGDQHQYQRRDRQSSHGGGSSYAREGPRQASTRNPATEMARTESWPASNASRIIVFAGLTFLLSTDNVAFNSVKAAGAGKWLPSVHSGRLAIALTVGKRRSGSKSIRAHERVRVQARECKYFIDEPAGE